MNTYYDRNGDFLEDNPEDSTEKRDCQGCGNLFPRTELTVEYGIKRTAHAQTAKKLCFCSECVIDFREDLNEDYKPKPNKQVA